MLYTGLILFYALYALAKIAPLADWPNAGLTLG